MYTILSPGIVSRTTGSVLVVIIDDQAQHLCQSSYILRRESAINLLSFLLLTLTNARQATVVFLNRLSMLPIVNNFTNAGTELKFERFTFTMFHCKRQICHHASRPSIPLFVTCWLVLFTVNYFYTIIRVVWDSFYLLIFYFIVLKNSQPSSGICRKRDSKSRYWNFNSFNSPLKF